MADWSKPTITSNYITFVDEVKARDVDAISLQKVALTNPPVGSIRLLRAPVKFQEWNGTSFVDQVITVEGGGTGSAAAGGARTNLGLGTMAIQNANAVAITGGTIADITSNGVFAQTGSMSAVAIAVNAPAGQYGIHLASSSTLGQGLGLFVQAGTSTADYAFNVSNRAADRVGFLVRGDMVCSFNWRLIIPVGANLWAT